MTPTWTTAASEELEHYFREIRTQVDASGAEADEVIEDFRRAVEREVATEGLAVVTEADVRRVLAKVGAPAASRGESGQGASAIAPEPSVGKRRGPGVWWLVLGVVLPAVAWAIEVVTGMCASAFFDPLPTLGHVVLAALVPVVNFLCWRTGRAVAPGVPRWLVWANSAVVGVAFFYSLQFSLLLLPGILAVVCFGLGFLPWSPVLSLIAAVGLRKHLRRKVAECGGPALAPIWPGAVPLVVALLLFDGSVWATRIGLNRAASHDPELQRGGLVLLRRFSHHETLLRACYGRSRRAEDMDLFGQLFLGGREVDPERAREIYYRTTGRPFNEVAPPVIRTARGTLIEFGDWTWDEEQGGERVGGRIRGLSVQQSRLDAHVEADAALAYCEWTLEFRNDGPEAREARAQILLPPGGVVSRLTLWVNGEEREAAFASRSRARGAYREVAIVQRRDPVLVTTAGPDRVLMQCYPVAGGGGSLKVRLGITTPMAFHRADEVLFRWPRFIERNFSVPEGLRHSLWLDSSDATGVSCAALPNVAAADASSRTAHGDLTDRELASGRSVVKVRRRPEVGEVWTADSRSQPPQVVSLRFVPLLRAAATKVVVVVDGSFGMRHAASAVADAISRLPADLTVEILLAGDQVVPLGAIRRSGPRTDPQAMGDRLRSAPYAGGQDNVPALAQAWDLAAEQAGAVVLWIHGPQPVLPGSPETIRQRMERATEGPRVVSFQVLPGPVRLLEQLDDLPRLEAFPRMGELKDDLTELIASVTGKGSGWSRAWSVREGATPSDAQGRRGASFQLARLWAFEAAEGLRRSADVAAPGQALSLASRYQLVTPLSGAVVLETQEQFEANRLQAASASSVPGIPKPGLEAVVTPPRSSLESVSVPDGGPTAVLVLLVMPVLMGLRSRRRTGR